MEAQHHGPSIPRPLGLGEATPRRESPAGPPYVVAMERPCWAAGLLFVLAAVAWVCERVLWGDEAALWEACLEGWGADVLRSEPVLSEDAAPDLVHLDVLPCVFARLVFLPCFWGVVSPRRSSAAGSSVGIESRDEDDDDVNSEREALVVVSEPSEALACGRWGCARGEEERGGGWAAWTSALLAAGWVLWCVPGSMSIDCPAASAWHRDAEGR